MTSIAEQILENVKATLDLVSTSGGYGNDLEASRPDQVVNPWSDLGAVVAKGDLVPVEGILGFQTWDMPITVSVGIITAESYDGDTHETRINSAIADVYRALLEDETRGGLAIWTQPGTHETTENGVAVPFTIRFRHTFGNPFSQT